MNESHTPAPLHVTVHECLSLRIETVTDNAPHWVRIACTCGAVVHAYDSLTTAIDRFAEHVRTTPVTMSRDGQIIEKEEK